MLLRPPSNCALSALVPVTARQPFVGCTSVGHVVGLSDGLNLKTSVAGADASPHLVLAALPRDLSHPDRNFDQRLLLKLRTSIQLADFVELCSVAPGREREEFHALLSGILEQIGQLSEAIAQLYFSHAVVTQEISGIREERE